LTGIVESPHLSVTRVVWHVRRFPNEIGFRIDHIGPGTQCLDCVAGVGGIDLRETQPVYNLESRVDGLNRQWELAAGLLEYHLAANALALRTGTKTHQNLARDSVGRCSFSLSSRTFWWLALRGWRLALSSLRNWKNSEYGE
jgi:hypothetical protein